jgi:hypothetical protein
MHIRIMQADPLNVFTQKIQRTPHPAYSPDLTPRNFFLFSDIKRKFTEYDSPTR